ncbi:MAG: CHRD domain-containing protein [Acidimicrobiia bacterium]|nr:CHRD domain-containing protein [Acidimicrobiia bacterium]
MTMKTLIALVLFTGVGADLQVGPSQVGPSRTFVARLSPVPITAAMQETVAGLGSATAMLTGNQLVVDGKFSGLRSPATVARLHLAAPAMRGPAVHDLKVSSGTSGTITGSVELTAEQRQALERGRIYIQLHSEKAPEGNLWGWLEGKK